MEIGVIKVIKEKLDYQVFKEIREKEESVVNLEKKDFKGNQDFPEFKVFKGTKVKKEKLDHRVTKEIKDNVETKEIKAKLDHLVIKGKEVIKVRKECLVVLEALVSLVKKD